MRFLRAFAAAALLAFGPAAHAALTLDDFETGVMRTTGGHNLWDNYSGEGAAAATSVTADCARFGSYGLKYHMTAGTPYMHFYANNGATWDWAHAKILSGSWATDTYNRLTFWVKHPAGFSRVGSNQHLIEFGTYTRCQACDPTTQNAGGTHHYHYVNPRDGVWTKVLIDWHPQHNVGGSTSDPGALQYPTTDGAVWNYFDALTRFYWNSPYNGIGSYPGDLCFDHFQFEQDSAANEDVANIATLEASWNSSTNLLHLGFVRRSANDTTYTVRYALSDIHALGFGSATLCGTVAADGNGDYVNKEVECTVNLAGQSNVYLAVQMQGRTDFRQINLELGSGGLLAAPGNFHRVPR